jgi:hypothetical protein
LEDRFSGQCALVLEADDRRFAVGWDHLRGDPLTIYAGKDQSLTNGNDRAIVTGQPYCTQ